MNVSYNGLAFTAKEEGIVLVAYDDVGTPAIGAGHQDKTLTIGVSTITLAQAVGLMESDQTKFAAEISAMIKVALAQFQFDAIHDFAYNLGPGTLLRSTLLAKLNLNDFVGAAAEFGAYNRVKGNVSAGLTARRAREADLFLHGNYGDISTIPVWTGNPKLTRAKAMPFPNPTTGTPVSAPQPSLPPVVAIAPAPVQQGAKTTTPPKTVPKSSAPPVTMLIPASAGWDGTVGRGFTADEFAAYIGTLTMTNWRPSFVTLHNTGSPLLSQWHSVSGESRMQNLTHYYRDQEKWSGGPHLFIADDLIWAFTPLTHPGVHSPSWNNTAWGVEMVGDYDVEPFGSAVMNNAVAALAILHTWRGISPDTLKLHKEDPNTTHRDCPGKNVSKTQMIALIKQRLLVGGNDGEHLPTRPAVQPTPPPVVASTTPVKAPVTFVPTTSALIPPAATVVVKQPSGWGQFFTALGHFFTKT